MPGADGYEGNEQSLGLKYLGSEIMFDLPETGRWLLRPEPAPPVTADGLTVQLSHPTPELVKKLGLLESCLVITAFNPLGVILDQSQNAFRNSRLHWRLTELGLKTIPCVGRSTTAAHHEPSFWIPTEGKPGIQMAVEFEAKNFDQHAIFKFADQKLALIGVAGPKISGEVATNWWRPVSAV
jgi:hypothetical protein